MSTLQISLTTCNTFSNSLLASEKYKSFNLYHANPLLYFFSAMEFLKSLPPESGVEFDESVSSHETEGSLLDGSENFGISNDTLQQKVESQTTQSSEERSR